jgi:hypothetical protein
MTWANPAAEARALFTYRRAEQKAFPYLGTYARLLRPRLEGVLADEGARERFMLAGLFLSYRAFNHMGMGLSTDPAVLAQVFPSRHTRRLRAFHRLTGQEIHGTGDYLRRIGFWRRPYLLAPGWSLYRFVVAG